MFELANERPPHWPSLEIPQRPGDELNCSQQSGKIYSLVLRGLLCSIGLFSICMKNREILLEIAKF